MIIILKQNPKPAEVANLEGYITGLNLQVQHIKGIDTAMIGLAGDTSVIDIGNLEAYECVDRVMKISEPYKKANRKFHPENTIIDVKGLKIGGEQLAIMAGPCSIESEEQMLSIAQDVKAYGANMLRGGAFKPRTSPYAFQGMGKEGLELLKAAGRKASLPIISEIMSTDQLNKHGDELDIIQIGARNMQNFELLKEVGQSKVPVLLKRGFSATIEEFLMSAEYIMAGGNNNVILCERGVRTFETYTRNCLDLGAIPVLKKLSHLPVIVDPSHATGIWWMVEPMSKAAIAAGADGLIIEVHNNPAKAKCDGQQSLTPEAFANLVVKLKAIAEIEGRRI
jgi:3-deoxy-7-phosphoheptulonate synthase